MKVIKRTTENFIDQANIVHRNKYDYSPTMYRGVQQKVSIGCPIHGIFEQPAYKHLAGLGCNKCGRIVQAAKRRRSMDDIIKQFISIHNNLYDYSLITNWVRDDQKIDVICYKHGVFHPRVGDHLLGTGCPKCSKRISKGEQSWLDYCGVPDTPMHRQVKLKLDDKIVIVDGLIVETNTVYEFWGDYWHGNPVVYVGTEINSTNKKPFGELYQRTLNKKNLLSQHGYTIIDIWESEWKAQTKSEESAL